MSPATAPTNIALTRKDFYELAAYCRQYALELALYDPHRVNLKQCYQFNQWLPHIKAYDQLAASLPPLQSVRPVARWQLMVVALILGLILLFVLPPMMRQFTRSLLLYGYFSILVLFYFVPERLYGGTIGLIEAKVLCVVETMEKLLMADELGFSEAAFFQTKENLAIARCELRQQLDLAHRKS